MVLKGKVVVVTEDADLRHRICARLARDGHAVLGEPPFSYQRDGDDPFHADVMVVELEAERAELSLAQFLSQPARPTIVLVPPLAPPSLRGRALIAGAVDVVGGPFDVDEIAQRVMLHLRRTIGDGLLTVGDIAIDEAGHVARRGEHTLDLTATEFRLLVTLARNVNVVLSKRQLLSAVWGFDDYDVNLVEVHTCALRRKLEMFGPRVIHTVRALGYVMRASSQADFSGRWSA